MVKLIIQNFNSNSFPTFFRNNRILSCLSLEELAQELAEEHVYIDPSVLSRWQTGTRHPFDRFTVIKILEIFIRHKSVTDLEQANEFIASAGFGYLTKSEAYKYFSVPLISSVTEKAKMRESLFQLSDYHLKILATLTSSKDSLRLYMHYEHKTLLNLFYKLVSQRHTESAHRLWEYLGFYLWNNGAWLDMSECVPKLSALYLLSQSKRRLMHLNIRHASWLYYWQGEIEKAHVVVTQGLTYAAELNEGSMEMMGKVRLAKVCQGRGEFKKTRTLLMEAHVYYYLKGEQEMVGDILTYMGETRWLEKKLKEAVHYFSLAERYSAAVRDYPQISIIQTYLACLALQKGSLSEAKLRIAKSLFYEKKIKRRAGGAYWNVLLKGLLSGESGRSDRARQYFAIANREAKYLGMSVGTCKMSVITNALSSFLQKHHYVFPSHS